ncbi:acyl-coenzyme A thioesterase 13-like [Periplaneta americana]|uniref:acyl-coenzyme A thioesterase 13-like n=1 Tax=Periplaneta americana TaxID=6978 RepID=UPI0037E92668
MSGNGFKIVEKLLKKTVSTKGFDRVLEKVKILNAGEGRLHAELVLGSEHHNPMGTLHGGLTATLVDALPTLSFMTHQGGVMGPTVNLNISYMKTAKEGDTIVIDSNTLKAGKALAFFEVEIRKKQTGELIAKGFHTKYID